MLVGQDQVVLIEKVVFNATWFRCIKLSEVPSGVNHLLVGLPLGL